MDVKKDAKVKWYQLLTRFTNSSVHSQTECKSCFVLDMILRLSKLEIRKSMLSNCCPASCLFNVITTLTIMQISEKTLIIQRWSQTYLTNPEKHSTQKTFDKNSSQHLVWATKFSKFVAFWYVFCAFLCLQGN